ncbi:MAG: hypothetical protein HZC24_02975 [Rhodocyclales bacterium]|nr:hypothetical protein [Rhodocyclales bacterium]
MFHPATLLLAWAGLALTLPQFPLPALVWLLPAALLPAFVFAGRRTRALMRRTRWLLLSLALLFAFGTPGLAVPGWIGRLGATQDGLLLAGEHLARLLLLLATLSLLHERIGTSGVVAGLHWLLRPLQRWFSLRERIVVRLMLVLEYVENGDGGWRSWLSEADGGPDRLALAIPRTQWPDWLALLLVACAVGAMTW